MMSSIGFKLLCPHNDPADVSDDNLSVAMCNGEPPFCKVYEINEMFSPILTKRLR